MDSYEYWSEDPPVLPGPRVFISYSSDDAGFVTRLSSDLEHKRFTVWVDRSEIRPGESIPQAIDSGLRACDVFLPVMTPSSLASAWCRAEVDAALMALFGASRMIVVPVLLKDCEITPLLSARRHVDFRQTYESGFLLLCDALSEYLSADESKPNTDQEQQNDTIEIVVVFQTSGERLRCRLPIYLKCDIAARRMLADLFLAELPQHRREGYLTGGDFFLRKGNEVFGSNAIVKDMNLQPDDEVSVGSHLGWPWIFDVQIAHGLFSANRHRQARDPARRFFASVRATARSRLQAHGLQMPSV